MGYLVTEKSTAHGNNTPHGYDTPHKYPETTDSITKLLLLLGKNLYPTGRAWYMPENGDFENFNKAIDTAYARLVQDAKETIDSTIPDNDGFDEDDASLWEFRLGLITNDLVPIADRRQAILRKLAYPANVKARQHPLYIESQLRAAGFDVYVHENTKPYKTPSDILALDLTAVQHGGITQHGDATQSGGGGFDVIANSLDANEIFNIGSDENLWSTFFISGLNIEDIAEIPIERRAEFRELVLKLKPAQTVVFILINFV